MPWSTAPTDSEAFNRMLKEIYLPGQIATANGRDICAYCKRETTNKDRCEGCGAWKEQGT